MNWPDDADGDVLRRLEADSFDFTRRYLIDFNVDFNHWPPKPEVVAMLRSKYSQVKVINPDEEDLEQGEINGWILVQIENEVSYAFVTKIQKDITALMLPYGGSCHSWGVMH